MGKNYLGYEASIHSLQGNEELNKHIQLIKDRGKLMDAAMLELAKGLLTVCLYNEQQQVVIENCRIVVAIKSCTNAFGISIYTKKVSRKQEGRRISWKDFVGIVTRNTDPLKPGATATYSISSNWEIGDRAVPKAFIQLLPAAKVLVDSELDRLRIETENDIASLGSMNDE